MYVIMARVELMLVAVLIAIALLLGILFGGSSIWLLKPAAGGEQVVEKVVNKYVCSDGAVKDAQSECPIVSTNPDGKTTVVCPPCETKTTGAAECSPFRTCDCTQCAAQCGTIAVPTTTTLTPPPVCKACTADSECGSATYSDLRCKNDEVYKMYIEPTCLEDKFLGGKCCKTKETYTAIQTCPSGQRCKKAEGCVTYTEDAGD
jgi:hypothetical protein